MVSGSRIEGGPQILSAGVRKTIQSIKEIVGNHSDADIYVTLKETNMDPNETAQKLLNQDPFHEVKRKREKRKEATGNMGYVTSQPRKNSENPNQGMRFNTFSDRKVRRGGLHRNFIPDARVSREFRVVRDNRTNQNTDSEPHLKHNQISAKELEVPKISEKSSTGAYSNQKQPVGRQSSQSSSRIPDTQPREARVAQLSDKKDTSEDRRDLVVKAGSQKQAMKPNDSVNSTTSSNNSAAGVYSSSSDPVHVPSPDSRPAANIGAIKREVGAVGVRRQSAENSAKNSSVQSNSSSSSSHLVRDGPSRDSFRSSTSMSKSDQPQTPVHESSIPSISVSRPFMNNQYIGRQHQPVGHQKASQTNKEWKPKSSQKQSSNGPGVIGTPAKSASPSADVPMNPETESDQLQDKLSRVNISENQNVIIAAHIRVSETDRHRLTFGSLGTEFESSRNPGYEATEGAEESYVEASASVSISAPESASDGSSGSKQSDLLDECLRNSGTNSPASGAASEQQLTDKKESSSHQDLDSYADVGLIHDNSPSYTPSESQQQQDPPQLPSFSAYDPQTMYDIPYFRSAADENVRGHGLQFPQEALSSHTANSIPASTIAMVQQAPQMAQMYPQVHVSHYANLMPYRQFLSPVYVPPMAVPGFSNNTAYPHPSNGNSYLLMPGGSSHLNANGLKYGIQQFKSVPSASPTGFGSFTNPTGYAINAPGVASATGLEDSTRLKYKDGNLFVPNPQGETSEIWMSPRDLPSMQSGSYYNMVGQSPHAAAYMPSHSGHASFNAAAAAAQSSHMQFPGMYNPNPQPAGIPSPHHLSPAAMGGNVGVGVAAGGPGAQVGAYQQPQLGHMNWTGNF